MSEHTPEPWFSAYGRQDGGYFGIWRKDTKTVIARLSPINRMTSEDKANARRIVACVNACRGMSTESLEIPGTPLIELIKAQSNWYDELCDVRDKISEIEHQRDASTRQRDHAILAAETFRSERDEARSLLTELRGAAFGLSEAVRREFGMPMLEHSQAVVVSHKTLSEVIAKVDAFHV